MRREEGRKEGNFSLSLFMEQICNRCTRLLAEGQKQRTGYCENGAAQGTCHHIPGKVSKHSNHFLRWLSTCQLGRALSPALMLCRTQTLPLLRVSSPVITVPQATAPSGSKMTLAWFHQVKMLGYKTAHFCGQSFPDGAWCAGDRQSSAISRNILNYFYGKKGNFNQKL